MKSFTLFSVLAIIVSAVPMPSGNSNRRTRTVDGIKLLNDMPEPVNADVIEKLSHSDRYSIMQTNKKFRMLVDGHYAFTGLSERPSISLSGKEIVQSSLMSEETIEKTFQRRMNETKFQIIKLEKLYPAAPRDEQTFFKLTANWLYDAIKSIEAIQANHLAFYTISSYIRRLNLLQLFSNMKQTGQWQMEEWKSASLLSHSDRWKRAIYWTKISEILNSIHQNSNNPDENQQIDLSITVNDILNILQIETVSEMQDMPSPNDLPEFMIALLATKIKENEEFNLFQVFEHAFNRQLAEQQRPGEVEKSLIQTFLSLDSILRAPEEFTRLLLDYIKQHARSMIHQKKVSFNLITLVSSIVDDRKDVSFIPVLTELIQEWKKKKSSAVDGVYELDSYDMRASSDVAWFYRTWSSFFAICKLVSSVRDGNAVEEPNLGLVQDAEFQNLAQALSDGFVYPSPKAIFELEHLINEPLIDEYDSEIESDVDDMELGE